MPSGADAAGFVVAISRPVAAAASSTRANSWTVASRSSSSCATSVLASRHRARRAWPAPRRSRGPRSETRVPPRAVMLRRQFDAVIEIEVAHARLRRARSSAARRRRIRCGSRSSRRCDRPAAIGWRRRRRCASDRTAPNPRLTRNGATARSMVAMRRVASPSRGVTPFQMPQTFSQLSQPSPLKKANCRSSVLSRFQRP